MSDNYRTVRVTFRHLRDRAFFVDHPSGIGEVSIPRSLIHGADDRRLDTMFSGERVELRLRDWKARELGFGR